jgi:hypothetical protein
MAEKYNGWTNYETFNVALWLGNDQGSEEEWSRRADECWAANEADGSFTREERAALELADCLKEEIVDGEFAPDLGASMYADLLGAALSEVSWLKRMPNNPSPRARTPTPFEVQR